MAPRVARVVGINFDSGMSEARSIEHDVLVLIEVTSRHAGPTGSRPAPGLVLRNQQRNRDPARRCDSLLVRGW